MSPLCDIVARLGGDLYAGGTRACVPAPGHSKRDRSLSLMLAGGRIVWCAFTPCNPREVFVHLGIAGGAPATAAQRRDAARQREREKRAAGERAWRFCEALWQGTKPLVGSPAETYLREARGLSIMPRADVRFHPAAPRGYDGRAGLPAMVAMVRSPDGRPAGLHVTSLRPDGSGKALGGRSRLMFGSIASGAVRLAPIRGDLLAVAEGIETALAFAQIYDVPTWAALSTSGLRGFTAPAGLRRLIVAADNDPNGAGLDAARALAKGACAQCEVVITTPPRGGDFSDELGRAHG
jgi:phage/plasmid primase-like uncharacterized protein